LIIRPATAADAGAIADLIRSLAVATGETSPITADYARGYVETPGNLVLLACEPGGSDRVVGLVSCSIRPNLYHAGDSALIEELVVARDARGGGIGGALIADLLARLEARHCVEVSVTTMPDNEGAIRFYKKHGLTDEAVFLEKHFGA